MIIKLKSIYIYEIWRSILDLISIAFSQNNNSSLSKFSYWYKITQFEPNAKSFIYEITFDPLKFCQILNFILLLNSWTQNPIFLPRQTFIYRHSSGVWWTALEPFPKRNRIKIAERFTRDHRGQKKALFRSCSSITRGKNARTTESSFSRLVGIEHAERFRSSSDDLSRKEPRWNIHQRILVHSDTGHT